MGTTFDNDITVNIFGDAQGVRRASFGLIMHSTEDVEAGFTELYRIYESPSAAQQDADLSAGAKTAVANFFSQPSGQRPRKVGIAAVTYASLGTDLDALLAAVSGTEDVFYGVTCEDRTKATQLLLAAWTLANAPSLSVLQSLDSDILAGTAGNLFETVNGLTNGRSAGIWHDTDAEHADLAWIAQILGPDPDNQASVAYDKTLAAVGSVDVTAAEKTTVLGYGGNLHLTLKSVNATGPGTLFSGTTDFIDELITKDWFQARLEEGLAQLKLDMSQRNSKIPYTNEGLVMIQNVIEGVFARGVSAGHFLAGSLVVDRPDISDISSAVIASRIATMGATVTSAGGIKDITLNIGVING